MLNLNQWLRKRNKILRPDGKDVIPELFPLDAHRIIKSIQEECGEKINVAEQELHILRLSIEYISMVLDEEEIQLRSMRKRTFSSKADLLNWQDSTLGKITIRLGEKMVDNFKRLNYGGMMRALGTKAQTGETKAAVAYLESMGKSEGESVREVIPVEWIQGYDDPKIDGKVIQLPR